MKAGEVIDEIPICLVILSYSLNTKYFNDFIQKTITKDINYSEPRFIYNHFNKLFYIYKDIK